MKMPRMQGLLSALVLAGAASAAQAELYRCVQPDGRASFQQWPCEAVLPADAPPPAAPAPAPAATRSPAATADPREAAPLPALTRRKREVLDVTAMLLRCRADQPGFLEVSAVVFAAWQRRHASTLSEHDKLLAAKVRDARFGVANMPLHLCTEDWVRSLEPLTRQPEPRFAAAEKTWSVFVEALRAADRATALRCLTGRAEARWKQGADQLTDEDLRRMGGAIRALKVQWGDDYMKEAVAVRSDERTGAVTFRSINEEWRISDL